MKKHYDANQGDEIKWRAQEAYCSVLSKLREAMEEPQQETMAFIDDMHSQLEDMITTPPPTLPSTSSVSGESLSLSILICHLQQENCPLMCSLPLPFWAVHYMLDH